MKRRDLIFRVFVSSTFSDMIAERNTLHEKTFPELRNYCQQRGARFQAIDLRWGVSQEAALDQQTMRICLEELRRCQTVSPRPNFVVLLGNRYGWRPLPAEIDAQEFEELLAQVPGAETGLLTTDSPVPAWRDEQPVGRAGWYRKDLNAVPVTYVLQPRTIELPRGASDDDRKRIRQEEARDWNTNGTHTRNSPRNAAGTSSADRMFSSGSSTTWPIRAPIVPWCSTELPAAARRPWWPKPRSIWLHRQSAIHN